MYFDDLKIGMAVDTAPSSDYFCHPSPRKRPEKKVGFVFEKVPDFLSLLWYVVVLTEGTTYEKQINELWHGNIIPREDSRKKYSRSSTIAGASTQAFPKQPSSNTPSVSKRGWQWRCRKIHNIIQNGDRCKKPILFLFNR